MKEDKQGTLRFSNEQKMMNSASSYGLFFKKFVGEGERQEIIRQQH